MPGRINKTLVDLLRPGIYYGQCRELCGTLHRQMPIVVDAVPLRNFVELILEKSGLV